MVRRKTEVSRKSKFFVRPLFSLIILAIQIVLRIHYKAFNSVSFSFYGFIAYFHVKCVYFKLLSNAKPYFLFPKNFFFHFLCFCYQHHLFITIIRELHQNHICTFLDDEPYACTCFGGQSFDHIRTNLYH